MTMDERNQKIKLLTFIRDHLEQSLPGFIALGATEFYGPYRDTVKAINAIKADLWGLRTGQFPYAQVKHETTR